MDFIETFDSVKDNKLKRPRLKDTSKVVIDRNGTTLGELQKQFIELQIAHTKLEEEFLKYKENSVKILNDLNETNAILHKRVEKLENSVNTLISLNK